MRVMDMVTVMGMVHSVNAAPTDVETVNMVVWLCHKVKPHQHNHQIIIIYLLQMPHT
jgi:hypothetical protein